MSVYHGQFFIHNRNICQCTIVMNYKWLLNSVFLKALLGAHSLQTLDGRWTDTQDNVEALTFTDFTVSRLRQSSTVSGSVRQSPAVFDSLRQSSRNQTRCLARLMVRYTWIIVSRFQWPAALIRCVSLRLDERAASYRSASLTRKQSSRGPRTTELS